jgi:O-antigen/teichoic acid export membrane protein
MIAVAIIPWGINYMYISIARFEKRTRDVIIIAGISTVLSLGLSFGLLLKMGMIGVGIGYLVGQFISMLAVVVPIRRIVSWKAAGP